MTDIILLEMPSLTIMCSYLATLILTDEHETKGSSLMMLSKQAWSSNSGKSRPGTRRSSSPQPLYSLRISCLHKRLANDERQKKALCCFVRQPPRLISLNVVRRVDVYNLCPVSKLKLPHLTLVNQIDHFKKHQSGDVFCCKMKPTHVLNRFCMSNCLTKKCILYLEFVYHSTDHGNLTSDNRKGLVWMLWWTEIHNAIIQQEVRKKKWKGEKERSGAQKGIRADRWTGVGRNSPAAAGTAVITLTGVN